MPRLKVLSIASLLFSLVIIFVIHEIDAADQKKPAEKQEPKHGPVYENEEAAAKDADYAIQGEYKGDLISNTKKEPIGLQIIARGKGKFHGVLYLGGLPGDGWKAGDKKLEVDSETQQSGFQYYRFHFPELTKDAYPVAFNISQENGKLNIKAGAEEGVSSGAELKKVLRQSPTLGEKPPKDAIVLFDGSDTKAFNDGAKMNDAKSLIPAATTKQKFKNFIMHVEFRSPYQPEDLGQARGNSGIYLQYRYELQILDSFGLKGEHNECGGFYKRLVPEVNMCLPPLTWQTYDIDLTAAVFKDGKKQSNTRVTVKHNGVVIHNDKEIEGTTAEAKLEENDEPGPMFFQDHRNPVQFRNIWIVEKK